MASPTSAQIIAQVRHLKSRLANARIIGLRSPERYAGPSRVEEGQEAMDIIQCDSPLAIRIALRENLPEHTTRVLVTPLDETDLGDDIRLRLPKRRLFDMDGWDVVRQLFQAREVDPELRRYPWMADKLLAHKPALGYQPAMAGYLSPETVWPQLLRECWGLKDIRADLPSLLIWSLGTEATTRIQQSEAPFREAATSWLVQTAGSCARSLIELVGRGNGINCLSMGLALGVLFHSGAAGRLEGPIARLEERYFGGKLPKTLDPAKWSKAAVETVLSLRLSDPKAARLVQDRADKLLVELGAESLGYLSEATPLGLNRRLQRLGKELSDRIQGHRWRDIRSLEPFVKQARDHRLFSEDPTRGEHLEMALRLARWLSDLHTKPPVVWESLAEAAAYHQQQGGRVDWARRALRSGDLVKELSDAFSLISDAVAKKQESLARSFAKLLVDSTSAGSFPAGLLGVEQVLERVVASLATGNRVLLVVIDGMSAAVYQELLADLTRVEWEAVCPKGRSSMIPCLAALPSATEFSRTSLLTGKLQQGNSESEKEGFRTHPALLAASIGLKAPLLFHKASLHGAEGQGIDAPVRQAIEDHKQRVVGIVLNAVDDHLLKGEQLNVRWETGQIRGLEILLNQAQTTGMVVVLCSDHGHILENQSELRPADGGERWRLAKGTPHPDEMEIQGLRVLVPGGKMIAPVTEKIRFGPKRNGYHGGLTPQEMVAPVAVLHRPEVSLEGWIPVPTDVPGWWDDPLGENLEPQTVKVVDTPTDPTKPPDLFSNPFVEKVVPVGVTPEWVAKLLNSDIYNQQFLLLRRNPPSPALVEKVLAAMDSRGGKMTLVALARAVAFPESRMAGLVANVQRLLNVDGYMVFDRDEASNTLELKRDLLLRQFGLE